MDALRNQMAAELESVKDSHRIALEGAAKKEAQLVADMQSLKADFTAKNAALNEAHQAALSAMTTAHGEEVAKLKAAIAASFLSALRASAADSSTRTTCAQSTMSIASGALASYLEMTQAKRTLSRHKKRSAGKKTSGRKW
jgi:hypothetical protein